MLFPEEINEMTSQGLVSPDVAPTLTVIWGTVTQSVMQHCLGHILRAGWPRDRSSFPGKVKKRVLFQTVQISFRSHPASYSRVNGNVLPGGQAAYA